jgi:hypothetical protein
MAPIILNLGTSQNEWLASHLEKETQVPIEQNARWATKSIQTIFRRGKPLAPDRN